MHFFGSLTPSAANERASKLSHRPSGSPQAITLLVSFADASLALENVLVLTQPMVRGECDSLPPHASVSNRHRTNVLFAIPSVMQCDISTTHQLEDIYPLGIGLVKNIQLHWELLRTWMRTIQNRRHLPLRIFRTSKTISRGRTTARLCSRTIRSESRAVVATTTTTLL